jgi:peptidoglycan/LPS O-acetylase OafA/YrhL
MDGVVYVTVVSTLIVMWIILTGLLISGYGSGFFMIETRKIIFVLILGLFIRRVDKPGKACLNGLGLLGTAGYSIYALHVPLINAFLLCGFTLWPTAMLIIGVGIAFFICLKRPLTRLGRRMAESAKSFAYLPAKEASLSS